MEENNEKKEEVVQEATSEKSTESTTTEATGGTEKIPAVEEAKEAVANLKTENDRREKLIEEDKKLQNRKEAERALGGGSPAGTVPDERKEETNQEYVDKMRKNGWKKQ